MSRTTEEIASILHNVGIFSELPQDVLAEVAALFEEIEFKAGSLIFKEGDEGDSLYIVADGQVRIHKGEQTFSTLGPNELFGEMAIIESAKRTASASAAEDLTLLRLDKDLFMMEINNHIEVVLSLIHGIAQRLTGYVQELNQLRTDLEQVILPLGISLSTERDINRLLERILIEAKTLCHADAGSVYLRTEEDGLQFAIMRTDSLNIARGGTTGEAIPYPPLPMYDENGKPNLHNVASAVAIQGTSVNIPDVYVAADFDFSGTKAFDEQTGYLSRSCLTVPLKDHAAKVIGVLQLFNAQDPRMGEVVPFGEYQQLLVESLTSQAAVALNTQMLLDHQRALLKLENDLHIGREVQAGFLPDEIYQPSGWEVAARYHPAREVAGDFYDVFPVAGGKLGVLVADVCDKGVGAALFMALGRSLLRGFSWLQHSQKLQPASDNGQPDFSPVRLTNDYITSFHLKMNMFFTLFYGIIDPETGVLWYINGGHNPPLVLGPDGQIKAKLKPTGPAVGMLPNMKFRVDEVVLEPGDVLYAFTDGVPEARNGEGEFYTEERLEALLEQIPPSAAGITDLVDSTLIAFVAGADPFDDVTMMAVRRAE